MMSSFHMLTQQSQWQNESRDENWIIADTLKNATADPYLREENTYSA